MKDDETLRFSRIIQLGWSVGSSYSHAPTLTKSYFVRPNGFQVTADATKFHKCSHEYASSEGRPLDDVLREFMDDVTAAFKAGGRVVAHQEIHFCLSCVCRRASTFPRPASPSAGTE